MLEMTYLRDGFENDTAIISFEGDRLDIYELRDYAKMVNLVKGEVKEEYYRGLDCPNYGKADEEINIDTEEDLVNHPSHYTNSGMECILEMVMLYGFEETMSFCKLNAHKYRKRALDKGGRQDIDKSDWYINEYKELLFAMETDMTPLQYVLRRMN